jgi:hypothetical protein
VRRTNGRRLCSLIAALVVTAGCTKHYLEIRVRDGGAVGVSTMTNQGFAPVFPPDGADRSLPIPLDSAGGGATLVRHQRRIVVMSAGAAEPLELVDHSGTFPPIPPNRGFEIRGMYLHASYNLTPSRILPDGDVPSNSVPVVLSTDVRNVTESRKVHEPRRWPAYVLLPLGGLAALSGVTQMATDRESDKLSGALYVAGSVPLLVFGMVYALSSASYEPFDLSSPPPP